MAGDLLARCGIAAVAAVLGAAIVAPAGAQESVDRIVCSRTARTLDTRLDTIEACGRLIESGRPAGRDLAEIYHHRGANFFALKQTARAIQYYDDAVRADASYAPAYNARGIAYKIIGQAKRAIENFDQAIRLDPVNPIAYYSRGVAHSALHQDARAVADYDQVIRLAPNFMHAYVNRGIAFYALGQPERAVQDYSQAIALDPRNANGPNDRCRTIDSLVPTSLGGETSKECNTEALRVLPSQAAILGNRARAYLKLGQFDEALKDFDASLLLSRGAAVNLYGRSIIRERRGDQAGAAADQAEARRLSPNIDAEAARLGIFPAPAAGPRPAR